MIDSLAAPSQRRPLSSPLAAPLTAPGSAGPGRLAGATARGGEAGPTLRLTRRGRLVLLAMFIVTLLAAFTFGRATSRADSPARPEAGHAVVVHPGDTLWSIAETVAPHADPRDTVRRISEVNHLTGGAIRAGQQLVVPAP